MRPSPAEFGVFYSSYVERVPETDVVSVLESQLAEVGAFWISIPEDVGSVVHPPYTWSIRQVLEHVADAEQIFGYRLLRISRGDQTPLPGYDENVYATACLEQPAPLADITVRFVSLRRANLRLIRHLSPAAWDRTGTMSDTPVTVRALAYMLAGHVRHHADILRKRLGRMAGAGTT
jgi:DinB superfamily